MNYKKLGKLNDVLTILVVMLGIYIAISPLVPAITEWYKRNHRPPTTLTQAVVSNNQPVVQDPQLKPQGNRLVIPAMNLDEPILEGTSVSTVDKGLWRKPNSNIPGNQSNTVIIGHRFAYNPGVAHALYSLDIVKPSDKIGVYWQDKLLNYKVVKVLVVDPHYTQIEQATPRETLTIYTCTPIWTSKQRLVIIAELSNGEPS